MFTEREYHESVERVRALLKVRDLFHAGRPQSFDTYPADPESIAIVDGLIHRVLSKLTDRAAGD